MITASSDYVISLWKLADIRAGIPAITLKHQADIKTVVLSADGKRILTAGVDGSAYLIEVASGRHIASFKHGDIINSAVFSPDEKLILTAGWDNTPRLWDVVSKKQIASLKHNASVNSAVFSPDGNYILTASWDSAAHLWSMISFKEIGRAKKNGHVVNNAVFSPDGKWILTAGMDKTARIWRNGDLDLPPDLFELQAKATTGLELNVETVETQFISPGQWYSLKADFYNRAEEHYKTCKYPAANLWRLFYPEEAERIRPATKVSRK